MKHSTTQPSPAKLSLLTLAAMSSCGAVALAQTAPNFGPNVTIITPSMTSAQVASALNAANGAGQFDTARHAVLFMPGSYAVNAQVGFYESVAGLGQTPGQVTINGGLSVDQLIDGNMTQNFWRSQENLSEVPTGGLSNGTLDWGVSQGASLRRVNVAGNLAYVNSGSIGTTNPCAEASGGFTADTAVSGNTNPCSQQQWYTRNSSLNGWTGYVWNYVFSGVLGAPAQSYPGGPSGAVNVTNLPATPASREKPFLYVDGSGNYFVFSPGLQTNSKGTSWSGGGLGAGTSIPIGKFFIAQPSNTLAQINAALASGQNLILTPGIYQYSGAINVTNPNTVVLGLGYATVVPQTGTAAISVSDVDGVQIAGLIVDAGPVNSPVLLEVGNPGGANASHASNPTSLNDVFFRVGGAAAGKATTSLQVDSGNVILDNIWAWRADHGNGVGWTVNTAAHGLVVNGANVEALGLAVEHYQQEQTLWNGSGGETIFYQSELPYDVPSQSAWMDGSANGYPSYVVASGGCGHQAYGLGVYSFFNQGVNIVDDNAITVPNATGVKVIDAGTVWLGGAGQITHVVNGTGPSANSGVQGTLEPVASYTGSGTCTAGSTPPVSGSTVAIDAGGGAVSNFVADTSFSGGGTYAPGATVSTAGVASAAPAAVYGSEREGVFSYTVSGLSAGTHTVRLHFAELYFGGNGQREFNVSINGTQALTNFDVVANAGGKNKAVVKQFTTTAVNGQIVINFTKGAMDQPEVNGIEVQ